MGHMTVDVQVNEQEYALLCRLADQNHMTVEEWILQTVLERIEDEADLALFEE